MHMPILTENILITNTAPAAVSFATLAKSLYSFVTRSTHLSIDVFIISNTNTIAIITLSPFPNSLD